MSLTAAQLESLDTNGFLSFDSLISARSVIELRSVYDRILAHDIAAEGDRWLGGVTRQVMFPSKAHALFDDNEAREVTRAVARVARTGFRVRSAVVQAAGPSRVDAIAPGHGVFTHAIQPEGLSVPRSMRNARSI